MPKFKERRAGDDLRIFKGKYCRDVNADIQDEFEDDIDDDEICGITKLVGELHSVDDRNYDEILLEAFEKANEKSSKTRIESLTSMCQQLERHHVPKFLNKHMTTIVKIIECGFERNIGAEVKWIAEIVVLCYMQLSKEKKFLKRFRPMVLAAFDNQTFTVATRSYLCKTVALSIFLHKNGSKMLLNTMVKFEGILTEKSFVRVNGNSVTSATGRQIEDIELLVATLEAWTFLYTLLDSDANPVGDGFVRDLVTLFKCSSYDLRIACAKTIVVIYGCRHTEARDYVESNLLQIIDKASMIRKDFYPYNYDDKTRDTLLFNLKNGTIPRREIKVGNQSLVLDTWSLNVQYDMLSSVFGSDNIPKMLQENAFLFNLLKDLNSPENPSNQACVSFGASASGSIEKKSQLQVEPSVATDWDIEKIKNSIEKVAGNLSVNFDDELSSLSSELQTRCASSSVLISNKDNILRIFLLVMKRNKESEKLIAIEFATQVVICLGDENQFSQKICHELMTELRDPNIHTSIVSKTCTALAFIVLLKNESLNTVLVIMGVLRNIFIGSFPRNRKPTSISEDIIAMQCNALEAWGLMLTFIPQAEIRPILDNRGRDSVNEHLNELLQSKPNELRVVTGEVICLIMEHLRGLHLNLHINSQLPTVIAFISKCVKDTSVAKHFRTQNSRFHKVLSYLQDGVQPKIYVKVGKVQHELHSWSACLKYKKLCEVMGTGMKTHLSKNDRLRNVIPIDEKSLAMKK